MSKIKQVLIVRRDLNMRRGKECAQCGHAASDFLIDHAFGKPLDLDIVSWFSNGTPKITVKVNSEAELDELYAKALQAGLRCHLVVDEGLTEFNGQHTKTVLSIGPNKSEEIDKITGHLPLY